MTTQIAYMEIYADDPETDRWHIAMFGEHSPYKIVVKVDFYHEPGWYEPVQVEYNRKQFRFESIPEYLRNQIENNFAKVP